MRPPTRSRRRSRTRCPEVTSSCMSSLGDGDWICAIACLRARPGVPPRSEQLLSSEAGRVVFLTLGLDREESLPNAHRLAGELEDELRQRIPDIADVVIHTQP